MTIFSKKWTDDEIQRYVGEWRSAYLGYAADDMVRLGAASGGAVSAVLLHALESGLIDGALVCRTVVRDGGKVRNEFLVAKNRREVLEAQGSSYVATAFVPEAFRLIEKFDGNLAVVGLPCDLKNLALWGKSCPGMMSKVIFSVSLFCGHASLPDLVDGVASRLSAGASGDLESFRFRVGRWRGRLVSRFSDGRIEDRPFGTFSLYQNLSFFCPPKCLHCCDHFGYSADICVGDVWDYRLKNHPIKQNALICKSVKGEEILRCALNAGALCSEEVSVVRVLDGQRRSAPSHYNVSARAKAGKRFGIFIKDTVEAKVRWHEYLAAWIRLFNFQWSRSPRASWIFKMPRAVLKLWLYILKGLESLS